MFKPADDFRTKTSLSAGSSEPPRSYHPESRKVEGLRSETGGIRRSGHEGALLDDLTYDMCL